MENSKRFPYVIPSSAETGEGLEAFLQTIDDKLSANYQLISVKIPFENGKEYAWLHQNAQIQSVEKYDNYQIVYAKINNVNLAKLSSRIKIKLLS